MSDISLNRLSAPYYDRLTEMASSIGVAIVRVGEFEVVDAGVKTSGSKEAGVLVSKMCSAGLMNLELGESAFGPFELPTVTVWSDNPALSFFGGVYGDWEISLPGLYAIGSGPARGLALPRPLPRGVSDNLAALRQRGYTIRTPQQIFESIAHEEISDEAYLLLETSDFPEEEHLKFIASSCRVEPSGLHVVVARQSSPTMAVRLVSSVAETGLHKMALLGLEPRLVKFALGKAPIPPVLPALDDQANGKANDAIRFGGIVYYELQRQGLEQLLPKLDRLPPTHPSIRFQALLASGFYSVDLGDFAAAKYVLTDGSRVVSSGDLVEEKLISSFFGVANGRA
ncbi:MAG: methenyltetrahydromethanopterin cyclohydrolase [Thermoprotei archaeon]|nr:methenyltetrahydromethanopterin cyclohydrolase [TACK group archaeon]